MEDRTCWVCLGTAADTQGEEWVSPCRCRGTSQWVHQRCLLRWINDDTGNNGTNTKCPQCRTPYTVVQPRKGLLISTGDVTNALVNRLAPAASLAAAAAFVWAGLGAYGAITVHTICGPAGRVLLQTTGPLKLFMWLPTIPLTLVLVRVKVAVTVRQPAPVAVAPAEPPMAARMNGDANAEMVAGARGVAEDAGAALDLHLPNIVGPVSITRLVAGGLALPYVSAVVGNLFFNRTYHPLDRAVYGAAIFLLGKNLLQYMYHAKKRAWMGNRRVIDYVL